MSKIFQTRKIWKLKTLQIITIIDTSRNVTCSIADGVTGIFIDTNFLGAV